MTPRTKEQFEEIRIKRIKQILDAAEQVYIAQGNQFDIRDVAKKAALGYGTVYHYYSNKQILLQDLFARGLEMAADLTLHLSTAAEGPLKSLEAYCNTLLHTWRHHPSVFLIYKIASENFAGMESSIKEQFSVRFQQLLYQPLIDCLGRAIEAEEINAAPDAEKLANGLLGSLIGSYGIYLYHDKAPNDPSFLTRLLLTGLVGEKEAKR
ncbi:TetR/AcrR family transcriptional regulator [Brevibacillus migulae]|uniref:TetR/AcrR family transcriptional regulator n=1 Tax=Brevibacillus migulae TaxID=1644114 RepID=UPI00106EA5ED|nr:TetR/AcrR family transcriptional regulator [Brevibacillus migulae]